MELRSLEAIVSALNDAGARYIIVGGIAVNAHGFVRMTRDVDIVLELQESNISLGLNALFQIGYQLAVPVTLLEFSNPETRAKWRVEKNMIVLKLWSDLHGRTPVDIFIYEPFPFTTELLKSQKMELRPNMEATIVSLETLLEMKRQSGRPQDHIDIQELQRNRMP